MIIQQCARCHEKGKKYYCDNCLKSADFFDIYQYNNIKNRFDKGRIVGRIKAFTWHDATEYVKNTFFFDLNKQKLNINCEKDFAYVESNSFEYPAGDIKQRQENFVGYKIYQNKELNGSSVLEDQTFSDLTIASSDIINNDNKDTNSAVWSNTHDKQQQKTIAGTIRQSQKNQSAPNTPTMITRVTKQEKQEKPEEDQNSLRNRMSQTT